MLVTRTQLLPILGILLALAGCALPHANHGPDVRSASGDARRREAAAPEDYETLIRVDHEGNVFTDGPPTKTEAVEPEPTAARPPSARRTTQRPVGDTSPTPLAKRDTNFDDLATAIDAPQVDAARVAELVAAHQRSAEASPEKAADQAARPAPSSVAQEPSTLAAAKPTTASPAPVELPPGIYPTVVRTTRFDLEYDDQVLGEGGIAKVELYGTRDAGRTWDKLGEDADRSSPYSVEMPEEGVFGFRIAVAGTNGLASRAPKNGELPELWVRVDLSEPIFRANLRPAGETTGTSAPQASTASGGGENNSPAGAGVSKPVIQQSATTTGGVMQASHAEEIPPTAPAAVDWKAHLASAIAEIEGQLEVDGAAKEQDANHQSLSDDDKQRLSAQLRMLYLAAGRHEDAIKGSVQDDKYQNEFWSHQMHGMKLLVEPTQAPVARQSSAALAEFREATDTLAGRSDLQIKNLTFCTAANSFGDFEMTIAGSSWKHKDYSQRKFEPEQPIVLYFEVENFASEQTTSREFPDGAWRTSLRGSYTVVDSSGSPVDERELKLQDDVCRNRRHDYYVAYKSWIPKLNPGHYSLELLVEDTVAGKIGTSSIDFEVVSR